MQRLTHNTIRTDDGIRQTQRCSITATFSTVG